jgi:hypothetical protein
MRRHLATLLMRNHILLQKLEQEHQSQIVQLRQTINNLLELLPLIHHALVVHQSVKSRIGNHRLLQIVEELLDQTRNQVTVCYLRQIIVVALAQFSKRLVLFVNRHTLPENTLLTQSLRLAPEVMDQHLDDNGNADVAQLEVL